MAKKKVSQSQKEKTLPKQEDFVKSDQEVTPSMDFESSQKLDSLKSLNQILLKETFDRRQQVDSIRQSKVSLEMELTRSNLEKEALQSDLTRLGESAAILELESSVVAVFVSVQLHLKREMIQHKMSELIGVVYEEESEIGKLNGKLSETEVALKNERKVSKRLCLELDEIKDKLDLQLEEDKKLRANLVEFDERKRATEQELGKLMTAYDDVVDEIETLVESTTREKDSLARSLMESKQLVEQLEKKVKEIEEEKTAEMVELENGLNETVVNLRNEESKLRSTVADLEKKCFVGDERRKEMGMMIDHLVDEKKLANEALKQEKHKTEVMVNENVVMLEAKARLESEVSDLRDQVAELILKLEEFSRAEVDKIKKLESEYMFNLDQVKTERDEEKQNGLSLNEKVGALEKKIEESLKVTEKVKASSAALFAEKIELERQCEMLKKDISSLENSMTEAREEIDLMKGRVELGDSNSVLVLKMLKDTADFCLKDEGTRSDLTCNAEEAIVTIKNVFKKKSSEIDDMKRQLESCVEDAQKKKSFWTLLTSATTLLAAVSLAYVARGR